MTGVSFLASFLATGELHGIGIGSGLADVDRAFRHPFVDVVGDEGEWLRRDYGLVEFAFNPEPDWVVATATVQLHRLASDDDLAGAWARSTGIEFPRYVSWEELWDEVSRAHDAPELRIRDQGGFLEYRALRSNVSVLVVDDKDEERGRRVGDGDVWSLDLWAPARPS
ncbi:MULTISPECIES: hypothetical protein [unclassified Streptomyces]|uniref:hypothetical protein n=1 Tax=unclassified Streptomyces TaxID=2593676 RepID=UPI0004CABE4C|nr:hypothetical protein [Streptomyces sp. NRRL F-5727]